jgi:hypothetical protein
MCAPRHNPVKDAYQQDRHRGATGDGVCLRNLNGEEEHAMLKIGERDVLLQVLEHTAKEWEAHELPEEIRLSPDKIGVLLSVRALVANPNNDLTVETLRAQCPTFVDQYRQVLLREVEELIPSGTADS